MSKTRRSTQTSKKKMQVTRKFSIKIPPPPEPVLDDNGGRIKVEVVEPTAPAPAPPPPRRGKPPAPKNAYACAVPPPTRKQIEEKAQEILALQGTHPDEDLLRDIIFSALRLMRDGANRGELKILAATLRELRYAFKTFRPFANTRKVTVFGSARTKPDAPEYKQAHAFSEELVRRGFMVITGAGPGIMEAAQGGAGRDASFGVNIRLPFEQTANPHIEGDNKLINFRYFFTRKLCFVKEASAIALFPGGFGTHDEGFETLTLVQTGKASMIPIVFIDRPGGTYWREWADYVAEHLLGKGLISEEDMHLFKITDDIYWAADEISNYYKRYHSSRYVRDELVLRLLTPLPKGALEDLNKRFAPIMNGSKARIRESGPLPDEMSDQPELNALPRLVLPFNRKNCGKLRLMIDAINRA
ncbi:MAG: LOG family protein [Planctomycetes bacterium]|nr:LOG family protein [Planctomycetota bacterium]